MTNRLAILAVVATACALGAGASRAQPASDDARRIVLAFDDAWRARDVEAMMANVSSEFGCNFYGGISADQLRRSFVKLLAAMPDSRCESQLLRLAEAGRTVQVYVRRDFFCNRSHPAGAAVAADALETQCQVVYLQREDAEWEIVALEEFDPDALGRVVDGRFVDPDSGLSLALPADMFVVTAPRFGSLCRLVLRGEDLHGEILVSLDLFPEPFSLEPAFDHDLRDWQSRLHDGDIARRRPFSIGKHPAFRADGTYRGGACSLRPQEPGESLPRTFARVYAQPDPAVLLAFLFDAESRISDRLAPKLDALLRSVELAAAPGKTYGDALRSRLGFGPIAAGVYRCEATGFAITAPAGFTVERVPSAGCFRLLLRRAGDSFAVSIEANRMIDPDCDPGKIAEDDDEAFLDAVRESAGPEARVGHARVALGEFSWLRADRAAGSQRDPGAVRSEISYYAVSGPYMITAEIVGGRDEPASRSTLENVLRGVRRIVR